jgi:hypothetical protein
MTLREHGDFCDGSFAQDQVMLEEKSSDLCIIVDIGDFGMTGGQHHSVLTKHTDSQHAGVRQAPLPGQPLSCQHRFARFSNTSTIRTHVRL